MTTTTIEQPAQSTTCFACPYFQNFNEPNGRGWCPIFDQMARKHHKRTEACNKEVQAVELAQQEQVLPQPSQEAPQPSAPEPQQTCETEADFEQGFAHGQRDCSEGLHPLYTEAVDDYTCGYIEGYKSIYPKQMPAVSQTADWSVSFSQRWGWYDVWVNGKWVGRASNHELAERSAQKHLAQSELIRQQNAIVWNAYLAAVT